MTDIKLSEQKCEACEGGVLPLELAVAKKYVAQVSGWILEEDGRVTLKKFAFKGFYPTMSLLTPWPTLPSKKAITQISSLVIITVILDIRLML